VLARVTAFRSYLDIHGNQAMELAIAQLLQSGEIQRHIQRARRIYAARCHTLMHLLTTRLSSQLTFEPPSGGTALWARVNGVDVDEWVRRSRIAKVVFYPGGRYAFDRRRIPFVRLTFASLNEVELEDAVARMTRALAGRL
jgi:GntR family transcriptional regulator/MocR family aminotransferase